MSIRSFSSSSSSSQRPFSPSNPAPRGLLFNSPQPPTPSSTYDDFPTTYTPLFTPLSPHSKYNNNNNNSHTRPPLPNRAQSLSSQPTKLRKKSSTRSVASTAMSTSSAPQQQQQGEDGRYFGERAERYSLDSPSNLNANHPSSISSQTNPPSFSSQSSHSHSASQTSQRSTTSNSTVTAPTMDPSTSSSSSIPSTSITPSSPHPHPQRPTMSVLPSGSGSASGSRPSMDGGRQASSNGSFSNPNPNNGSNNNGGGGTWGGSRQNSETGGGGGLIIGAPVPIEGGMSGVGGVVGMSGMGMEAASMSSGGGMPLQFDEGVLRQLCDLDCALPLLTDRIKQSLASCRQVALFFKSRARVEESYARSLGEMGRDLMDNYSKGDGKAGSFLKAYQDTLRIHDSLAQQRLKFAQRLNEMGEELSHLAKEMEKTRKQHKDTGTRFERNLQDADLTMEKAKARFDTTVEELERILILKEGGNLKDAGMHNSPGGHGPGGMEGNRKKLGKAIGKGAGLFKGKNPAQMQKQEDDVRQRMSHASDAFRRAVLDAQSVRQEYFNSQLPKILRLLKQCADEVDLGTQYHLSRYAYLFETMVLQEGTTLTPVDGLDATTLGLKAVAETIDNRTDFKLYMQNFIVARGNVPRGPRREGLYEEGYLPPLPPHVLHSSQNHNGAAEDPSRSLKATFGVDLTDAMMRDGDEVPKILEICTEAIERKGLTTMGIYRLSGTTSAVQKLKAAFDQDVESVDLDEDAWADINVVSSTLKLWFRELPDPLFTYALYPQFMEAARTDNDRLRHIRLHEQVNELPDANYAALKYFMSHLHKIRAEEKTNQMSASNLSIVFGPTLFRQPPEGGGGEGMTMADLMSFQCKAVETILLKYEDIFI